MSEGLVGSYEVGQAEDRGKRDERKRCLDLVKNMRFVHRTRMSNGDRITYVDTDATAAELLAAISGGK